MREGYREPVESVGIQSGGIAVNDTKDLFSVVVHQPWIRHFLGAPHFA